MNRIRKAARTSLNFVDAHRGLIGLAAGATAMFALHRGAIREWNEFLESKGLTDEFYNSEALAEKAEALNN